VPKLDLEREKKVQDCCLELIRNGLVKSAHDCSEGGIAVALAESCISGGKGARVELGGCSRSDLLLFGETQSRILVTVEQNSLEDLLETAGQLGVPAAVLGRVEGDRLEISVDGQELIGLSVKELETNWREALQCIMAK
jgi:phosphoribosylformylglycinamidine synthase